MNIKVCNNQIKNAKLCRNIPMKKKIMYCMTVVFTAAAIGNLTSSFTAEEVVEGFTFDGYKLEEATRNGDTYNLSYSNGHDYALSFEDLSQTYNKEGRYITNLSSGDKLSIVPIIDKKEKTSKFIMGFLYLGAALAPYGISSKKPKQFTKKS